MLNEVLIKELRDTIKAQYGRNLSTEEAYKLGTGLIRIFDTLAKIDHREKYGID